MPLLSLTKLDLLLVAAVRGVLEQLLDQVDVRHDHAAAAVPPQAELVHRITVGNALVDKDEIPLPQVACDFAAREAPDGDNHPEVLCECFDGLRWCRGFGRGAVVV